MLARWFLVFAFFTAGGEAAAQVGNLQYQERGDVVFRKLQFLPDSHSAVYDDFVFGNASQVADPANYSFHSIVQMVGITGVDATLTVTGVQGISRDTLRNFRNANTYYGAFANISQTVLSRGANADTTGSRLGIINMAVRLMNRRVPVLYVLQPGDSLTTIKYNYMRAQDGVVVDPSEVSASNGLIDVGEIERVRSDAFVEYAYASNTFPILDANVYSAAGLATLQARAAAGNLTPDNQRAALYPGTIVDNPTISVVDQGGTAVACGTATNAQAVQIKVEDFISGPGRIEISKDGAFQTGNGGFSNGDYFDGTSRTFTSSDDGLSILGGASAPIGEGNYSVRAFDQAGNLATDCRFTIMAPPSVTMSDGAHGSGVADYLYKDFKGVSLSTPPSTIIPSYPGMPSGLSITVNAASSATLASVTLTGPRDYPGVIGGGASFHMDIPAPMPPGAYTLTAVDSLGNKTVAPVTIDNMTATIRSQQIILAPPFCDLSGTVDMDFAATGGLDRVEVREFLGGGPVYSTIKLSGTTATAPITLPASPFPVPLTTVDMRVYDLQGNTFGVNLQPVLAVPGNPATCTPQFAATSGPLIRTQLLRAPGSGPISAPLGMGASVSNLDLAVSGAADLYLQTAPGYHAGYQSAGDGVMYGLMLEGDVNGAFTLNLPVSAKLDPDLFSQVVFTTADEMGNIGPARPAAIGAQAPRTAAVTLQAPPYAAPFFFTNNLILEAPLYADPVVLNLGAGYFQYDGLQNSGITASPADPAQQPLAGLIAQAAAMGLELNGPVYLLGPEGSIFSEPAFIALPSDSRGGAVYELTAGQPPLLLPDQSGAYQENLVSARVPGIASYFAVFKSSPASAPTDLLPPRTTLTVGMPSFSSGTVYAAAATTFSLTAADDKLVLGDAAGRVDRTFLSIDTAAFSVYPGTFSLDGEGLHVLRYYSVDAAGNAEAVSTAAAALDLTAPITGLTTEGSSATVAGTLTVSSLTALGLAAVDPLSNGVASGLASTRYELAPASQTSPGSFASDAAPFHLAEGVWRVDFQSRDEVANLEALRSTTVFVDATPPVSSLFVGSPQFALSTATLLVSSRTPFAIASVDPVSGGVASGVQATFQRVTDAAQDAGSFLPYDGAMTLAPPDGWKTIEFYSRDAVQNAEVARSSAVLLDATPPEVALLSPAACAAGVCRVIKGKTPVLGTARDLHFANYVLDAAPGRNAAADFVFISSGAVAVSSGPLGAWDASALSGWQTLRLTAIDQVQNVAVLTLSVFVGDPATAMLLGNHEVFNMPTGVAVGADGKIYAADRDDDRIAVFTSTGGLTASFGGRLGDHEDGDKVSTSTLRLSEPSGVAVDAAGDVFVADTNHHRVLKLSPAGQVLLDLGRRETGRDGGEGKTEFDLGRGPGEFNHPEGVAVDAAGRLYVADTDNGRVQVFTSTGGLAAQFDLPALPPPQAVAPGDEDREPREKGADESPSRGRPVGIALDAAGNIYVADSAGHRALRFDPSGHLTLAIPIPGDKPGQTGRPYGVAVSAGGECLLVSDQRFGHVLKFDALGAQNLSFGVKERGVDGKPKPGGIPLRKPAGLALDASGSLFVVDRNAEKIEKFGLPNGQATVVVPPASPRDDDSARDVVDMADGGTVSRKDKAAVSIPALALADDLKVTVSTPTADVAAASSQGAQDKELKTASPPVDFGPEGTRFQTPVTLTLPFNPDLVALQGVDESSLKVNYWNKDKQRWEDLPSVVDPQNHVVKAQTSHFSLYQVFADSAGVALRPLAAADPTFTLRDAYAFPNPVRGAGAVTIRIQPGLADSVEVDVYDLTGRRVHSSADFTRSVIDDGNGKGAQYTFDHVWNVSGVGSGVYTYVITAKKAGSSDIHKSGKVGVIK